MLAFLGFITVLVMLFLVMTKKASPTIALIATPLVSGIIASFFMVSESGAVNVLDNLLSLGGMI